MILASFVFTGVTFYRLPTDVTLRWDVLIPWTASASGDLLPRAAAAFGPPLIALAVWLVLRGLATSTGERLARRSFPEWFLSERTGTRAVERFDPTFDLVLSFVVAGILLGHAVMLGTVLGWPTWTAQVFTAFVGVGMVVAGSSLPRTRPNWIVGIRTKRTLADPDLWRHTHRWFGACLMVAGVCVMAMSTVSAPVAFLAAGIGTIVSAVVATIAASRRRSPGSLKLPAGVLVLVLLGLSAARSASALAQPSSVPSVHELADGIASLIEASRQDSTTEMA
jgi:uncharacterized membrane protein HdeD (DUF308 family)